MNKLQIFSFLLVIGGMVAHLTACHDAEVGNLSSGAIAEGNNSGAVGGNIAPVAPIPEPLPPPVEAAFVLNEGNDDYFGSQGAFKPADTGNDDSCGNGVIDEGEECDDANVENGTFCKDCKIVRENCSAHFGEGSQYIYCTGNDEIAEDGLNSDTNIPSTGRENYNDAQEVCRKFGPFDLVTISSSAETTFLGSFITENAWIGINDIANEGVFVWISGAPVFYTNWASGEPNNDGNQDCGLFYPIQFTWDDLGCFNQLSFVCELESPDNTAGPLAEEPTEGSDEQPILKEDAEEQPGEKTEGEELDVPVDESGEIPSDQIGEEIIEQPTNDELEDEPLPNETELPADEVIEPVAEETGHYFDDEVGEELVADETEPHFEEIREEFIADENDNHFDGVIDEPVAEEASFRE